MKARGILKKYIKQIIIIFMGIFTFQVGIAQDKNVKNTEDQLLNVAKETVAAYESGNWDLLRKHVAPDATFYNLGSYDSLSLDQTIHYWTKGRETATPLLVDDGVWLANTVNKGPREGKWVLHWGRNTLTYPSGETVSFPYHVALKFRQDKVAEAHFYYDNNRIIRALGYEIQPPLEELKEDLELEENEKN